MWLDRLGFYGMPALATVLLHLAVVVFLTFRWPTDTTVVATAPKPQVIQAALVDAASLRPKPQPKPTPQPKKPPPKAAKPEPVKPQPAKPKPPANTSSQPAPAAVAKPAAEKAPPVKDTPPPVDQGARLRDEVLAGLDAAPAMSGSSESASARDTAVALIQRAVMSRWTRPPSARNGMVAVLTIQLVPTGDVVGVSVLESSGNAAFDRSAMSAVERAGRFPEVATLERDVFERDFRRFQLIFRPEDLRY